MTERLAMTINELKIKEIEQKLLCEKLIKSEEEMASILESMTDCFFAVDRNSQFTYVNRAAEIAVGKSRDELLGLKLTDVFRAKNLNMLPNSLPSR